MSLVLTGELYDDLADASQHELETAGVLLCSIVTPPAGSTATDDSGDIVVLNIRVLVEGVRWVPAEEYLRREPDGLTVSSAGYVAALNEAEAHGLTPLWFHTHTGAGVSARPSRHDELVDAQLAEVFRIRSGADHYGSVVAAPRPGLLAITGHLVHEGAVRTIDRLVVLGERLAVGASDACAGAQPAAYEAQQLFSRNVRAFGGPVQASLSRLAVAVVGCGGTGSAVAEQLVRLGVRRLVLVDPDVLERSNLTRVYGSRPAHVGLPKAEVLADHLRGIAPDLSVESVIGTVNQQVVARRLVDRDVIFGCTDDNSGRMVLARLAAFMRILVIDCGVLISSGPDGMIRGIDGRVTIMKPGAACLLCRGRIDTARAAAELMPQDEQLRLAAEGYAPALPGVEPAVVTYTTMVAACAVSELIELLTGYGPQPRPSEVLIRMHDREVSTNTAEPRAGHFCDPGARQPGVPGREPFLDKAWTQ